MSENYTYDALGRLTSVTRNAVTTQYAYDPSGNRTDSGAQVDAQDRLLQFNGISYTYDDDGQLKTRTANGETTTYTYDTLGQLRSVTLPSHRIDYLIDPAGRRIGKQVDGILTKGFIYDAQGRVNAELDGAGNLVSQFAYGTHPNVPDLVMQGGKTYRLVSDYLGSVRLVVDSGTSDVAQQIDYDVWGNVASDSNPGFQPFAFAGGLYDTDTKLVRFGARDYDPTVGRWTSKDPILFGGGQANIYVYVNNEPVNSLDPGGLDVWIEGPSYGEPAGHLSLAVGDPNGDYRSFAYGMDTPATFAWPAGVHGSVYEDTRLGGTVQGYMKTSSAEDQEIIQNLKSLVGGPNPFTSNGACYTFGNTCRDFTREVWAAIRDSGAGTLVNPPATIRDNSTGSGVPWLSSACQN
jgi:RHS repeat-associated protein